MHKHTTTWIIRNYSKSVWFVLISNREVFQLKSSLYVNRNQAIKDSLIVAFLSEIHV